MKAGIRFPPIKIEGNLICDGHHRYIASIFAEFPLDQISTQTTAATEIIAWNVIVFQEDDWDTPSQIEKLNEEDANYYNMEMARILEILK